MYEEILHSLSQSFSLLRFLQILLLIQELSFENKILKIIFQFMPIDSLKKIPF